MKGKKKKGYNIYLKIKICLILTIPLSQIYSQPNKND